MTAPAPFLLVCLWLGVVSFGGGLAVVPEMHRLFVDSHAWLTNREFSDGYALAQVAPGPNMLVVVFYGYRSSGLVAALLAPLAIIVPGATVASICGKAWTRLSQNPWVVRFRRGLAAVGLGLMSGGVYVVGRSAIGSLPLLAVALATAIAAASRRVHPAIAVVLAGLAGIMFDL